VKHKEIVRNC